MTFCGTRSEAQRLHDEMELKTEIVLEAVKIMWLQAIKAQTVERQIAACYQ